MCAAGPSTLLTRLSPRKQSGLSDHELAGFGAHDFELVRVGVTAYGIILFGKVRIPDLPDSGPAYLHFRAFTEGPGEPGKFHSLRSEEKTDEHGTKTFRAIFTKDDPLDWFTA